MSLRAVALLLASISVLLPGAAGAEAISLIGRGGVLQGGGGGLLRSGGGGFLDAGRGALIQARAEAPETTGSGGSLFSGQAAQGFFAPMPPRASVRTEGAGPGVGALPPGPHASQAERIRHLIAGAEAGSMGYDAVQHGATRRPSKRPTEMTIGEIYAWIEATPGQPHAIGRYQFIPSTLRRLVRDLGAGQHEVFSPWLQDRLADLLLEEAGLTAASTGGMARHRFMDNLAKIWAGLPNSSGRSHYHGYAGNRATMAWSRFDAEMATIFPG